MMAGLFSILSMLVIIFVQNQLLLKSSNKSEGKDTKIFGLLYDVAISGLFTFVFVIMKEIK